jgi:hypothetical protein
MATYTSRESEKLSVYPVIESHFISHPKKDECRSGDANGEADNIQETKRFILPKLAKRCFQIISKHRDSCTKKIPDQYLSDSHGIVI